MASSFSFHSFSSHFNAPTLARKFTHNFIVSYRLSIRLIDTVHSYPQTTPSHAKIGVSLLFHLLFVVVSNYLAFLFYFIIIIFVDIYCAAAAVAVVVAIVCWTYSVSQCDDLDSIHVDLTVVSRCNRMKCWNYSIC